MVFNKIKIVLSPGIQIDGAFQLDDWQDNRKTNQMSKNCSFSELDSLSGRYSENKKVAILQWEICPFV